MVDEQKRQLNIKLLHAPKVGSVWTHIVSNAKYRVLLTTIDEPSCEVLVHYMEVEALEDSIPWTRTLYRFKERFEPFIVGGLMPPILCDVAIVGLSVVLSVMRGVVQLISFLMWLGDVILMDWLDRWIVNTVNTIERVMGIKNAQKKAR